jgi:hypothetical protein
MFPASDWLLVGTPEVQAGRYNVVYIDVYSESVAVDGEDAHVSMYRVNSSENPF